MRSPRSIWPLAIRFDIGCTSSRSMARLRGRAPYLKSVPSISKNSLALSGDMNHERLAGGSRLDSLLHHLKLNVNDPAQLLLAQRFEDDDFVQAVDELRRELPAGGSETGARHPVSEFPHRKQSSRWKEPGSPAAELSRVLISAAPRLLVKKTMAAEKSTLRLSPSVKVPLSRMPRRRFHNASDAFSISSNRTKLSLIFSVWC